MLRNMLLTDYLLKMITCGVQAQGLPPYAYRNNSWLKNLPNKLQEIIKAFNNAPVGDAKTHRFWFAADEVQVVDDEKTQQTYISPPKIRILKNAMAYDANGKMYDKVDSEGWPIYIVDRLKFKEIVVKKQVCPLMLF